MDPTTTHTCTHTIIIIWMALSPSSGSSCVLLKKLNQFKSPDPTSTPLKKALHVNGLDLWLAVRCAFIDKVPVLSQVYRDRNASNDPLLHLLINCLSCLISSHLIDCFYLTGHLSKIKLNDLLIILIQTTSGAWCSGCTDIECLKEIKILSRTTLSGTG